MNKISVSVIIPVYNTKKYLKKCIDSLLNQTLQAIEIIIVDDASTQDIKGFIEDEYPNNSNIIYLRNEKSQRPGGARNRGIEIARGKYISFCDSDDWVDLNLFEKAVAQMEKTSADIGMVSMIRENDIPGNAEFYKCRYSEEYTLSSDMAMRIISGQYNTELQIVPACINKIYSSEFLKLTCARFEEGIYFQGILFSVYTFLRAETIICIPNVKYHHYLRIDSVTQSFDTNHLNDFVSCFKKMQQYFKDTNTYEKYRFNYYKICEHYLNVLVSEIFEYVPEETLKKKYLRQLLHDHQSLIDVDDYFNYITAEELRQHIQPNISNPFTILY